MSRDYEIEFHLRVRVEGQRGAYEAWKMADMIVRSATNEVPQLIYPTVEQMYSPSRVRETLGSRARRKEEADGSG